jgi:hypothetical protein
VAGVGDAVTSDGASCCWTAPQEIQMVFQMALMIADKKQQELSTAR